MSVTRFLSWLRYFHRQPTRVQGHMPTNVAASAESKTVQQDTRPGSCYGPRPAAESLPPHDFRLAPESVAWRHNRQTRCTPSMKSTNHVRCAADSKILQSCSREA